MTEPQIAALAELERFYKQEIGSDTPRLPTILADIPSAPMGLGILPPEIMRYLLQSEAPDAYGPPIESVGDYLRRLFRGVL